MVDTRIYWHDSGQNILVMEIDGNDWDWQTTYAAMEEFKKTAESVEHAIYTILVFHKSPPIPKEGVFPNVRRMLSLRPKNQVLSFFVGTNRFFSTIFNTVGSINGIKNILGNFRYVNSLAQALEVIEAEREKLVTKP